VPMRRRAFMSLDSFEIVMRVVVPG
jgi:hypothetical protein